MLNFVPVFGNVHGVAFTGIKQHFMCAFSLQGFAGLLGEGYSLL